MRVAYVVGSYGRFTGSQRSLWLLVRGLDRRRFEPLMIFPGEGMATQRFRELDARVLVESPAAPLHEFGGGLLRAGWATRARLAATAVAPYAWHLAGVLRRERVELLHCNDARALLQAGPAARLLGLPVVWHVRGDARGLGTGYLAACGLLASRIVFVADGIRASVPRLFARKFVTIYNGIDLPAEAPPARDRAALGLPADRVVFVVVGSLVPFKGAHHLLQALRRGADPRILVVFVGDRPDPAYSRLLDRLADGLENVRFAGWDDHPADWFRAADAVVLPTIEREELELDGERRTVNGSEGFSRTVLEAMSWARPVVATRVAGAPEQVVDGETGLLVPPGDPEALAVALARLAGDADLRARAGAAGRARVLARFSIARMVTATEELYVSLAARARTR
jgi:glycosyltransferase involved in cell wall biosynthesis